MSKVGYPCENCGRLYEVNLRNRACPHYFLNPDFEMTDQGQALIMEALQRGVVVLRPNNAKITMIPRSWAVIDMKLQ